MKTFTIKSCIKNKDTLSNNYYIIKDDELFKSYLGKVKTKLIPFFQIIRFIAFLNKNIDISSDIIKFIKKNDSINHL